jgi:hypothetical protein
VPVLAGAGFARLRYAPEVTPAELPLDRHDGVLVVVGVDREAPGVVEDLRVVFFAPVMQVIFELSEPREVALYPRAQVYECGHNSLLLMYYVADHNGRSENPSTKKDPPKRAFERQLVGQGGDATGRKYITPTER